MLLLQKLALQQMQQLLFLEPGQSHLCISAALSLADTDGLSSVPAAMQEVGLETRSLKVQTQNGPALCV